MTPSSPDLGATDLPAEQSGPSRRTLIAGAAWSVPAIALVSSSPAFAASVASSLTVTTPLMQAVAAGTTPTTAVVTGSDTTPVAGASVSFTGPTGTSFSPATATADGTGTATTTLTTTDDWATPGSTLTITAVSGGASTSAGLTVLGANAYGFARYDNGQVNRGGTWYGTGAAGTGTDARTVTPPTQLLKQFPSPIASVAVGRSFSLALLKNGTVWSVGRNNSGQLGDGTTTDRLTWAQIPGLTGVTQITAGTSTGYALRNDGRVLSWGYNNVGQLGDGTTTNRPTPGLVTGITTATQIAAGQVYAAALLADSTMRTWGYNYYGQLGNGTRDNSGTPVTPTGITDISSISAGPVTTYAVTKAGRIKSWGYGNEGALGDGTKTFMVLTAVDVVGITNAVQVSSTESGAHALLSTGEVASWGSGYGYRLGDGTNTDHPTPVVLTGISNVRRVTGGLYNSFAQLNDGSIRWWGYDSHSGPTAFTGTTGVTRIDTSPNGDQTFFIRGSGASLALSTPLMQAVAAGTTPTTAVVTGSDTTPVAGASVSFTGPTGTSFSPATTTADGTGTATTTLTTTDDWATPGSTLTITAVSGKDSTSAGLTVLGANAYGYAKYDNGQVNRGGTLYGTGAAGTGTDARTVTPPTQLLKQFPSPIASVAVGKSFSLALLKNGTVWSVGRNDLGQLGDGTTTDRLTWAQIPGLTEVTQVACGFTSGYALRSDGRILSWGHNDAGRLGDGTTANRTTPGLVTGITTATQLVAGQTFAAALLADGTVRTWGGNYYGTLGNGTRDDSSTPVTATGVTGISAMSAGPVTMYALTNAGRITSWGYGNNGQLGDGSKTFMVLTAVDVVGITNAVQVSGADSRAHAVLATGEVASWGSGFGHRLGDGTNTDRPTPVVLQGISNVSRVTGGLYTTFALTTSGLIRWWGYDRNRPSPGPFDEAVDNVTRIDSGPNGDQTFFIR